MEMVFLIVSIVFFVLLGLSLLLGFFRNFKGNLALLISVIISTILCFLLTGVIANLLKNIEIGGSTIQGMLETTISEALEIKDLNSDVISEYTNAIAETIWRIPTFICLLVISYTAFVPLLSLLFKKIIPLSNQKTTNIGLKIAGMFMSFVSALICITLITAPVMGAIDIAKDIYEETVPKKELKKDEIYQIICEAEETPLFSVIGVYSGSNHDLQKAVLSSMMSINTKYGNIDLIKDYNNYLEIITLAINISESEDSNVLNTLLENSDQIVSIIKESKTIPVLMPLAVEVVRLSNEDINIDFDDLLELDWAEEIDNFADVLESIFDGLDDLDFDVENIETILGAENLPEVLSNIGNKISNSKELKDILLSILNSLLIDSLVQEVPETLRPIFEIMDLTKFDLSSDFKTLGEIGNLIYKIGLNNTEDINYLNYINEIGELIELPFQLSVLANNDKLVIQCLLEFAGLDKMLEENNITINFEDYHISDEIPHIKNAIVNILKIAKEYGEKDLTSIDFESLLTKAANSQVLNIKQYFDDLLNSLIDSDMLSNYLIQFISSLFDEYGKEWKSDFFIEIENGNTEYNKATFKKSLKTLINCASQFSDLSTMDLFNLSNSQLNKYENLLLELTSCEIINLNHLINIIEEGVQKIGFNVDLMEEITDFNDNGTTTDEWKSEIVTLFNILNHLQGVKVNSNSLQTYSSKIGSALNNMKNSYIFGNDLNGDGNYTKNDNIFNQIIKDAFNTFGLVKDTNPNGFITNNQLDNEDWRIYDWHFEMIIFSHFDTKNFDKNNVDLISLQSSEILKKYFDIAGLINSRIEDELFTINGYTYSLKDYVNEGQPFENSDFEHLNWYDEARALDDLISSVKQSSSINQLSRLTSILSNYPDTIAAKTAKEIIKIIDNI